MASASVGQTLALRDGRRAGYAEYGKPDADRPRDVEEVADALGLGRFAVLASSGGGPYALVCAHEIPERVTKAGVVSGVGLYDAPGAQGEADVLVPPAVGRHLAAQIPNCHATFFPGDGHLLFGHMREIVRAFAN